MDEEDQKNKEFLIVGQAFLHTGLTRVETLIQDYINASEQYHDSYSVALLNKIKDDIEKYRNIEDQEINECLKPKETSIYFYSGKIIKVFDKNSQCGFCVKKEYINDLRIINKMKKENKFIIAVVIIAIIALTGVIFFTYKYINL